ncbi:positive regulation of extrinsic apoptotic signaling pathway via death domain receptors protein [Branchiostoma belcheri]|nr:positive regulation of extrinsic apoptotic signaling pathway via death domain receptors protein [Branchiostoma belcheri]
METEITCQVINPNDVSLLLEDGKMLVSDIIELGPPGTTFLKPVTVQMQYNCAALCGATEAVVWVTEDRSQWTELKTTQESKDNLSVSVDHFSIFAVIIQPKRDYFTVPTAGRTLTSSTQPMVQSSFPEQAVGTQTQVTVQVQEVPQRAVEDIKARDESFRNLVGTSPIVSITTESKSDVRIHKPVTVRVPHPQHYMGIQHEGPTKLRVMSCEEGTELTEDWMDETENSNPRESLAVVEFTVSRFASSGSVSSARTFVLSMFPLPVHSLGTLSHHRTPSGPDLCDAAAEGDEKKVQQLLRRGVDVNCIEPLLSSGNTPLHEAAYGGHVGVVELLLNAGAQVDSRDGLKNTPLHEAAEGGHVGVAKLLLKAGAQVDSRDGLKNTPLHKAAEGGHVGVAKLLLKAGAQVDSTGPLKNKPLHKAASKGHVGVADLLLQSGAQVDSRNKVDNTPLHEAASGGHVGVAELLLNAGAQVDNSDHVSGDSPLHCAASGGHVGVAELLLYAGANVDSKDPLSGDRPLHCAASGGHVGVAEVLLKARAWVDIRNQFEDTPLHKAASEGHVGVVELLLKAGAQVDNINEVLQQDYLACPPGQASTSGYSDPGPGLWKRCMAGSPWQRGVEWPRKSGISLGSALELRGQSLEQVPTVKLLGVHVDQSLTFDDHIDHVVKKCNRCMAQVGRLSGDRPLHYAVTEGQVGVAELLLKSGAQVDSTNWHENAPLHCAASGGHVGVAELLLKARAQVDSRDLSGNTPLHKAASGGHVDVAKLLLKAGAQVESMNEHGESPGDIASSTDVLICRHDEKLRVLRGRDKILELLGAEKFVRLYKLKVGPEGGELQTTYCTVSVPRGAVTMETEITCQVINPNDVTLPLEDGKMLVSDIIELGPHGTTFHQPVTVQMQYNCAALCGATEAVVWVTEDRSQWTELKTTQEGEDNLSVSVDHFSIFAVIIQPKRDYFTVPTAGRTLTSSTQPTVQISFPEKAVETPTQVTVQVQEVPKRAIKDMKTTDQSSRGLVGTSPIVTVESTSASEVQFHKPVTVRVPHPQHYMDIQHEGPTKLRVMSCEEGTEDWEDGTNDTDIRVTEEIVEFEVNIYDDPEELGPIPLHLCRWLQHHAVQFILMQREDNANQFVVECAQTEDVEKKRTALLQEGYKGPVPTDSVNLFEGQMIEVSLVGNVWIPTFGVRSSMKQQITFHSQKSNRLHMQVMALEKKGQHDLDGKGDAVFYALPRVEVVKEKRRTAFLRKRHEKLAHSRSKSLVSAEAEGSKSLKGVGKYFYFIKEEVSTDWGDLAIHLRFNWATIRNIAGRNPDDKCRCMDMLQEWKKRKGDAATIQVLMEALSEAQLQSVVDGLKKRFPDIAAATCRRAELLQSGSSVSCVPCTHAHPNTCVSVLLCTCQEYDCIE